MVAPGRLHRISDATVIVLDQQTTSIGRSSDSTLVFVASAVSRQHAEIQRTVHGYRIVDLGSRNGTFVNGEAVTEDGRPLRDGDEIVVAGVDTLRFEDPLATPAAPAIGRLTGVWIDPETSAVWVDAQPLDPPLSERQQTLLDLLWQHEGDVVDRPRIIEAVWPDAAAEGVSAEALDALVKRVRARLRPMQLHGDYLEVHRGRGLRLIAPPQSGTFT